MSKIIQQLAASKLRENIIKTNDKIVLKNQEKKTVKINQTRAQENKKRKLDALTPSKESKESRVIYLGHIPNGFGEAEMRKFFSQFGLVKRIKLFRSARTGGSKGFAFVEFENSETAKTVAEAMNGYYLLERQIISHVIPVAKHHEGMFKPSKKPTKTTDNADDEESSEEEEESALPVSDEKLEQQVKNLRGSLRNKQKKLKALGIDFEVSIPV